MDYSQLPTEESSPWNTSPRTPQRQGFTASASGSEPPSPPQLGDSFSQPSTASTSGFLDQSAATDTPKLGTEHSTTNQPLNGQSIDAVNQAPGTNTQAEGQSRSDGRQPQQPQQPYTQQQQPQYVQQAGQQGRPQPARYQSGVRPPQRNVPQYKLQTKITALERTGKKDIILRFDAQTNLPKFRSTQFRDIRRTHAEFSKLADHLISSNPEAFVPAVPVAVTSAGAGTDEDEYRVKATLQRWLNLVCSNDVLMRDDEMVLFIESDFGYSPMMRMKQPATGVRRKVIKQFAPPPDDTPELHEARPLVKMFYLGTMETGQKVDKLVKARKGLGVAQSELGNKLAQMQVQEPHNGLGNAYRKLGRVIQTTGDYQAAQGTAEAATLADPLNYHSNDAFIVKETLTNRHILLRDLITAQAQTRSRLAATDRLKMSSSVKHDKVNEAISALDEAKSQEQYLGQKTQRVTSNLLLEKRRWFVRTAADLRTSLREYVMREIDAERRTLATLENVRPDIRAIDASGGLSRLGREAHPATRRASMASSQGPRGDAWSGIQRRNDNMSRSASGAFGPTGVAPVQEEEEKEQSRPSSSASKVKKEDDLDRVDARNAASRLATSTF